MERALSLRKEDVVANALSAILKIGSGLTYFKNKGNASLIRFQVGVNVHLHQLIRDGFNKFKLQNEKVKLLELSSLDKNIILGWWDEAEVFVGLDIRRLLGTSDSLSRIQIPEKYLRNAYINSFEVWSENQYGAIIAFCPDLFTYYVNNFEALHNFGESQKDLLLLSEISKSPDKSISTFHFKSLVRKSTAVSLQRKLKELSFYWRVRTAYGHQCAFCGTFAEVEAAHIIPVNHDNGTDETRNGLALCTLHHKAYDQALIAVAENYSVQISRSRVSELQSQKMSDGLVSFSQNLRPIIILPPAISDRPHIEYIRIANNIRGWK